MTGPHHPPRLAAWLAAASTPGVDREQLMGDLYERFSRRLLSKGIGPARRWYWGQALGLGLGLLPRRIARAIPGIIAPGTARAAFRSLVRSPWASCAAVAILAAGVAAPSAMFALADGVTSALPGDPENRVVRVSFVDRAGRTHMAIPRSVFEVWKEGASGPGHALSAVAAYQSEGDGQVAVGGGDAYASRYWGVYATANLFRMLQVQPLVGRLYTEDSDGGLPAVLIREDVWEERFGRDVAAIGQVLRVDGVDHFVAGVLPQAFAFPVDHRIWMEPAWGEDTSWSVVGRLAPGASPETARDQLGVVLADAAASVAEAVPPTVQVEQFTEAHFGSEDDTAWRVALISLLLVLATAVNVATVILSRGVSRRRETALRRALGASRAHVVTLTLMEVLFLALSGGAVGLLLSRFALQGMVGYLTGQATIIPYWMNFNLGSRSFVLAAVLTGVALVVAGGVPALRSSKADLDGAIRPGSRGRASDSTWLMSLVVAVEVTLSCFLLTVSSAVVEEAASVLRTGTTFSTQGIGTGRFLLRPPDYPDTEVRRLFLTRVSDVLHADPSVRELSLASALPGKEGVTDRVGVVGIDGDLAKAPLAQVRMVDGRFFPMLDLRPSAGRLLSEVDRANTDAVAVVNDAFVRSRAMEGEAVGSRISVAHARDGAPYTATIVGVVADRGVTPTVRGRPSPGVYLAMHQVPPVGVRLLMKTQGSASLLQVWHETVADLDPYLPLDDVRSLEESLRRGHGAATLYLFVFLGLGGTAFLIALVGLFGVHSSTMSTRVRDIGIRRALGAPAGRVLWEGMMRGLRPVGIGLALGVAPAAVAARAVVPLGPSGFTVTVVPIVLLAASALAIWAPTKRAVGTDPTDVLREG